MAIYNLQSFGVDLPKLTQSVISSIKGSTHELPPKLPDILRLTKETIKYWERFKIGWAHCLIPGLLSGNQSLQLA